jgi:hypothetical protein
MSSEKGKRDLRDYRQTDRQIFMGMTSEPALRLTGLGYGIGIIENSGEHWGERGKERGQHRVTLNRAVRVTSGIYPRDCRKHDRI